MSGLDVRVGSMRPSQLMWSYGIGAMVDLPRLSVMVEGLDQWSTDHARVIAEDRLLASSTSEAYQGLEYNAALEKTI